MRGWRALLVRVRVPPSAPDFRKGRNFNKLRLFHFCRVRLGAFREGQTRIQFPPYPGRANVRVSLNSVFGENIILALFPGNSFLLGVHVYPAKEGITNTKSQEQTCPLNLIRKLFLLIVETDPEAFCQLNYLRASPFHALPRNPPNPR